MCLQELKASPDQVPITIYAMDDYWCYWHGGKAYSGVALLVAKSFSAEAPVFAHPAFDFEYRIATVDLTTVSGLVTIVSVYVPNGGKDFPAKMQFLEAMDAFVDAAHSAGRTIVLCGDMNIARTDRDVHPKERKPRAIGQLPEERALMERMIDRGLLDLGRAFDRQ